MSFFEDEKKLINHFQSLWSAGEFSAVPIDYTGTKTPSNEGNMVRFSVKRAPSRPYKIGGGKRNYGSAFIQIITPNSQGPGPNLRIADFASSIWMTGGRPIRIGSLLTSVSSLSGPTEDKGFLVSVLDVPYHSSYSS